MCDPTNEVPGAGGPDAAVTSACGPERAAPGSGRREEAEAKSYTIHTVADFIKVPADRREDCLHEFAAWMACHDLMISLTFGIKVEIPDAFIWTDDDKRALRALVVAGSKTLLIIDETLKERSAGL